MPQQIIQICEKGAQLNYSDQFRTGNIILMPDNGRLIISGDLHGHRRNFEKIVRFADLDNNPETFVVLQEVIHGGPEDDLGGCLSYDLLFSAIKYKIQFPRQVHLILGNHDTAVICNSDVMKAGKEMNQAMKAALQRKFATHYDDIDCAIKQYLLSQPLAVKCPNGIWISHSLPGNRFINSFSTSVFHKKLNHSDMQRLNPVYLLTWGRRHSQKTLDKLAALLEVDVFIVGHQPQETGWAKGGNNLIILASDHNHGTLITCELAKSYNIDELIECIMPIAAIE
jgi:predicted phosphodiesterase